MSLASARNGDVLRCVYFDESGFSDEGQEPIAVVAAVLIEPDRQWRAIEEDAEEIVENLVPIESQKGFEFHAKELFSSSEKTKSWRERKRHEVLTAFLNLFPKYDVPILFGAVSRADVRRTAAKNTPQKVLDLTSHSFAFLACTQNVNFWLSMFAKKEVGLCFADEIKVKERPEWLKETLRFFRKHNLAEDHDTRWQSLVDTLYFASSHESIGIQLADSAAFFIKKHIMQKRDAEPFYKIIEEQIFGPLSGKPLVDLPQRKR